ncbi:deoxyhypusine synthase [Rhodopirellula maiorica SM1]|uniref:Deoxyhypusine synthase n=1 Tax=Rhodopirellula maiorica SM1 TaxID=1265738 RepID=M5S323_9BACT|nr:deoxyhypusine synthase family protein [Rhodopirellula maiorica]EMI22037.1 deoxyhypusine synthase [Rhodopirellula maiorica SM1]
MNVSEFLEKNFLHFNARETLSAAKSYREFVAAENGGKMMVTLAGAMSTGELGISLAEMIRQGKVHAITCTAANLEEDIFNLSRMTNTGSSKIGELFRFKTKSNCETKDSTASPIPAFPKR